MGAQRGEEPPSPSASLEEAGAAPPQLLQAWSAQPPGRGSRWTPLPRPPIHVFSGQPGRLEGTGEVGLEAQEMGSNTYLGLNLLCPNRPPGPGPVS